VKAFVSMGSLAVAARVLASCDFSDPLSPPPPGAFGPEYEPGLMSYDVSEVGLLTPLLFA